LANALFPLIEEAAPLEVILQEFQEDFEKKSLEMMRAKIGLTSNLPGDLELIRGLEDALLSFETDMTIFFRTLSKYKIGSLSTAYELIKPAFYSQEEISAEHKELWDLWFFSYDERLRKEDSEDLKRAQEMNAVNPKYVLRNYMAQMAIDEAETGNYNLIDELFQLLKQPYAEQTANEKWFAKRPDWARHKVGCSMLSCSS
jgi:uncharacterized protein YdiU (UPF0061 family)